MKRVAITGGRGRLAPGLALYLTGLGHQVQTFSRNAGDEHRETAELTLPAVSGGFDAILHLGWSSVPLLSEQHPGIEDLEDLPLAVALAAAASSCPKPPNIVFFSTAAIYGNTGREPVGEDHVCRPLGGYAAAKLKAEEVFLRIPRCTILRITNIFGAGCLRTRPQGIIPVLTEACRSDNTFTLWGDGSATKDYLAVEDLHRAVGVLLHAEICGVFNVASGHTLSVNELISLVSSAAGRPLRVRYTPHFPWDVEQSFVSSKRLQASTGWEPSIDPASAIMAMAQT